jgi:methyl-accepting chemotaxis protein WspA
MLKNLTIRWRILFSVAVVLVMMIIMSGIAYIQLANIGQHAREMKQDTLPGLYFSNQLMSSWMEEQTLIQEHILLDDPAAELKAEEHLGMIRRTSDALLAGYEKASHRGQDQADVAIIKTLRARYRDIEDDVLDVSRSGQDREAHLLMQQKVEPLFTKVQAALQTLVHANKKAVDTSTDGILGSITFAQSGIALSLAVALILALLSGYFLFRAITGPLGRLTSIVDDVGRGNFSGRVAIESTDEFGKLGTGFNQMIDDLTGLIAGVQKSSIQVNTSITEVAATSKQQQTTASEIAATTTEIGATSREIATTSRELVRTMEDVSAVAEQTAGLAGSGQAGLLRMNEMMREVVEAAGAINTKLGLLNEKATNVTQVVTTITKVADQTNLLSLNASIEAEKAGEYGRGFAVVATEIRRLADQTAVATYDIEQMVKDIQSAVSAGVVGMDKFSETVRVGMREVGEVGGQLSEIVTQVQGLVPSFEIVNEGMQAQATGAVQISEALGQLGEVATQTVESLRQSNLAVDSLKEVSHGLRESVSRFRLHET